MFTDRTEGGRQLAEVLESRGVEADIVLAIPRGGLPVGRAVADALDLPLDVVVARKLGAPGNPELAVGAVGADGATWINDDLVASLGVTEGYLDDERERQAEAAREKAARYRGDRPPLDLRGKTALVVDDGIATGATTLACVRTTYAAGADRVIVAAPVAPPDSVEMLEREADDVICVETPAYFGAVGRFYREFGQVPDEEAVQYLDRERGR
ncbi:phosphoribosyltransferase [Halomarina pelagica]|uniref:phosphoribosyltransferase n=1 Tax=Halomarina pelagica TaxID=2961599 RepID=UPI0020C566B8|nr:phosphoribosyltransferase family protein [Halomarina sp. BND7]